MNNLDIDHILKAMEKEWEPLEEAFEMAKVIYSLQEVCPIHGFAERDLFNQVYFCPICIKPLAKNPR